MLDGTHGLAHMDGMFRVSTLVTQLGPMFFAVLDHQRLKRGDKAVSSPQEMRVEGSVFTDSHAHIRIQLEHSL